MIHVHGGSALLDRLREAGLPGEFLEFREVLCQGPLPAGLTPERFRAVRAGFLAAEFAPTNGGHIAAELEAQDRALDAARRHDEMILWFGPELFCQAILLYLLVRLGDQPRGDAGRLSLVCVGEYPGVDDDRSCTPSFLSPAALREVFALRVPVLEAHVRVARAAWRALTDPRPVDLASLAAHDTAPLAYLGPALRRQVAELPERRTGLSLTEHRVLETLARGERDFPVLFPECQRDEPRRWLTDTILLAVLRRLARGPAPLVTLETNGASRITRLGLEVLAGRDWIAENGIDRWVGGVHLTPGAVWRWDAEGACVVPS